MTIFNIESHKNKTIGPFHGSWKFICGHLDWFYSRANKIKNIKKFNLSQIWSQSSKSHKNRIIDA